MDKEHRVTRIKEKNASSIYNDLAENGYILLYELDKTCSHAAPKDKTNNDGKKKQSHQHQHRYRLKESCNIM
jgi:hypothetical protein